MKKCFYKIIFILIKILIFYFTKVNFKKFSNLPTDLRKKRLDDVINDVILVAFNN